MQSQRASRTSPNRSCAITCRVRWRSATNFGSGFPATSRNDFCSGPLGGPMLESVQVLYAIRCYDSEDVVGSWTKEEDDAVMAKLAVVQQKLADAGRLAAGGAPL